MLKPKRVVPHVLETGCKPVLLRLHLNIRMTDSGLKVNKTKTEACMFNWVRKEKVKIRVGSVEVESSK